LLFMHLRIKPTNDTQTPDPCTLNEVRSQIRTGTANRNDQVHEDRDRQRDPPTAAPTEFRSPHFAHLTRPGGGHFLVTLCRQTGPMGCTAITAYSDPASGNRSENSPKIREASEMSLDSTSMPAGPAKVRMTGKKAAVANKGASSVSV
jgi:hypothetical protein